MLILETNTNNAARVKVIIGILYWSLLIPFHSVSSFDPICPQIPLTYDQIKKWTQSYPRLDSAKVMVEMTPSIVELKVISLLMIMVIVMVMGEMR